MIPLFCFITGRLLSVPLLLLSGWRRNSGSQGHFQQFLYYSRFHRDSRRWSRGTSITAIRRMGLRGSGVHSMVRRGFCPDYVCGSLTFELSGRRSGEAASTVRWSALLCVFIFLFWFFAKNNSTTRTRIKFNRASS